VFEILPKAETALWVIREIANKVEEQAPQQFAGTAEEAEAKKNLQIMKEKWHILDIYVRIMNARAAPAAAAGTNTPAELYKWFIFYDTFCRLLLRSRIMFPPREANLPLDYGER
jgi:hypothetical protein